MYDQCKAGFLFDRRGRHFALLCGTIVYLSDALLSDRSRYLVRSMRSIHEMNELRMCGIERLPAQFVFHLRIRMCTF